MKGKWTWEVKDEIKQIKKLMDLEVSQEKIVSKLHFLKQENILYIKEHYDETASQIMGGMDIEYQNDI